MPFFSRTAAILLAVRPSPNDTLMYSCLPDAKTAQIAAGDIAEETL